MDQSTWLRCSTWLVSNNRIYLCCHISAMPTVNRSCAGTARWDGACTGSVIICRKVDTLVPMTSRMTSLTKSLVSSPQGFRHVCRQDGGMAPTGKRWRTSQSMLPDNKCGPWVLRWAKGIGTNLGTNFRKKSCVMNKQQENTSVRQKYWDRLRVHGQQRLTDGITVLLMRWKQWHRERG